MALTIEQCRNMLPCNKHRLDDELELQPDMMQRISHEVVVANSRMLEMKDGLARVEARLTETIKEDSGDKITKDQVEAKVRRHGERTASWEKYQRARADYEDWLGVLESWRQKGYSLKTLADLYLAQYFSTDSAGMTPRQRDRATRADEGRAEMRKASHRANEERATHDEQPMSGRRVIL